MSILVLGGAGYIGSHTVYALCEQGRDVVVIDNLATGHIEAILKLQYILLHFHLLAKVLKNL